MADIRKTLGYKLAVLAAKLVMTNHEHPDKCDVIYRDVLDERHYFISCLECHKFTRLSADFHLMVFNLNECAHG
jgi:hypothetical protein